MHTLNEYLANGGTFTDLKIDYIMSQMKKVEPLEAKKYFKHLEKKTCDNCAGTGQLLEIKSLQKYFGVSWQVCKCSACEGAGFYYQLNKK